MSENSNEIIFWVGILSKMDDRSDSDWQEI